MIFDRAIDLKYVSVNEAQCYCESLRMLDEKR